MRSHVACIALSLLGLSMAAGQPAPARDAAEAWLPETYKARIFFRIDADRTEHHRQFQAMVKKLAAVAGFKKDKGPPNEEFFADTISGSVPGKTADKLNQEDHVRTVLLVPDGYELPGDAEKPVLVRMYLTNVFGSHRQREVADKTRKPLADAKFQECVGYDNLDQQRLMGWVPAGQLDAILKQSVQIDMPVPIGRGITTEPGQANLRIGPIQRIVVLREPMGAEPIKEPAAPPASEKPEHEKISADMRKLIASPEGEKPIQVEIVLRSTPTVSDNGWNAALATSGVAVDGRIGQLVCGWVAPAQVGAVAELEEVSTVRLPQPARAVALPAFDPKQLGIDVDFVSMRRSPAVTAPLASLVRRHEPMRSAVISSDFRGYEALVGKQLPKNTSLLDFTGERSPEFTSEPASGDADEVGFGTRLAVLLNATVPATEMLLVRIDPSSPYQVEEAARCVNGGRWTSQAIVRRETENRNERSRLDAQALDLRVQRQLQLNSFGDDKESTDAREKYRKAQAEFDVIKAKYDARIVRYLQFQRNAARLKGVSNVLVGLHWPDGHAQLAEQQRGLRSIDPELLRSAAWIQAIPRTPTQTWSGHFRDTNSDGAMEFTTPGQGATSRTDVNFLAWKPHAWQKEGGKEVVADLPAKAVVQATLQWREVHSAAWKTRTGEDIYRKPLTPFRVVVLRQRDPAGKEMPADLFEVVERSTGLADRIENDDRTAVYQITVRFQVGDQPGRYAIRIEGAQPESTAPAEAAKLPNAERFEVHPKLTVTVADPATRAKGRVVLESHSTRE